MLKALVIVPNERTRDVGALLAIARAEAQKREHTHQKVNVKRILFDPVTNVYVALYVPPVGCLEASGVRGGKRKPR